MIIKESTALLLVTEGDDDHFVLSRHSTKDLQVIAGTGGREHVLRAATIARERNLKGVKFLVDRDIDDFCGANASADNVFVSDHHDVMMDLLLAGENVHYLVDIQLRRLTRRNEAAGSVPHAGNVVDAAFDLASHLAAARIVSRREAIHLDFQRFSFSALRSETFTVEAVAEVLVKRNQREDVASSFTDSCVQVRNEIESSKRSVVGDHDLFKALSRVLGVHDVSVQDKALVNGFMGAITCAVLSATSWFAAIERWCAANARRGFNCGVTS
ncbi:hypothetical protein [Curtobacterium sp. BH-2-1-1]|uniref:hypothetical protein n=1 Tax=Curtobacterium sp. BH-2-1-1 TaxID=1905847 RepID=UPI0011AAAD08|nr:hypothetical protein [Curtobacterium sp. BH-2-1-1]